MKVKYKKYERVETIVETDLEYPIQSIYIFKMNVETILL